MADPATFQNRIAAHVPIARGLANRLTRSPVDGADVLQEALVRAFRAWPGVGADAPLEYVRAWLCRIVHNVARSRFRADRARARAIANYGIEIDVAPPAPSPEAEVPSTLVADALAALPRDWREIVERVDLRGEKYRDAAAALGIPIGTVMSRLSRARAALADTLRPLAVEYGITS